MRSKDSSIPMEAPGDPRVEVDVSRRRAEELPNGLGEIEAMIRRALEAQEEALSRRFEAQMSLHIEHLRGEMQTPVSSPAFQRDLLSATSRTKSARHGSASKDDDSVEVSSSFGIPSGRRSKDRREAILRKPASDGDESSPEERVDRGDQSDSSYEEVSNDRRFSALKNVIAPRGNYARQVVSIQQETYKGVKLEHLSVFNAMRFIDDVNRYQAQWQVKLKIAVYVSDAVKRSLIAKSDGRLTEGGFYEVTAKVLLREIQLAVRPRSILAFAKTFSDNISFFIPDKYIPTATNLEVLYDALLLYRDKVLLIYEFLSKHNSKNIPPCNEKEGGLLKIFIEKIPFEYGTRMMRAMKKRKFEDIFEFIEDFMKIAYTHKEHSHESRETMRFVQPGQRPDDARGKVGETKPFQRPSPTDVLKGALGVKSFGDRRIHFLDDSREEDAFSELLQLQGNNEEGVSTDVTTEVDSGKVDSVQFSEGVMDEPPSVEVAEVNFVATRDTRDTKGKPRACFNKLFNGKCENPKCTFAHDRATLEMAHAEYEAKLKASEFRKKGVFNITEFSASVENKEILAMLDDPQWLGEELLFSIPEAAVHCAVNKAGIVCFDNGDQVVLDAGEVLFDSGALHASYVSEDFLMENLEALESKVIAHQSQSLMADGSPVRIKQRVPLRLEFKDSQGDVHSFGSVFLVMPNLSYKFIIGLPDIVKKVGKLFQDMINCAIEECSGDSLFSNIPKVAKINMITPFKTPPRDRAPVQSTSSSSVAEVAIVDLVSDDEGSEDFSDMPELTPDPDDFVEEYFRQERTASRKRLIGDYRILNSYVAAVAEDPQPELGEVLYPWSTDLSMSDEAPEDFPSPCAFSDAIHFMEMSRDEAAEEFRQQIEAHVSPEMRAAVPIVKYLLEEAIDVFVPTNWTGINGIPPIEFEWKDTLPERMKPPARPVNPKLFQHAKKEFDRLMGYFYEYSQSPIASCLVIAPKATAPHIRFCGDYVLVNKEIISGHYPIPIVKHELHKIINYPIYVDIDLTNSYHQFVLGDITRQRLSVQTPWGQVQPKFMPEGVTPASGILQAAIRQLFDDYDEWTIRIFDNLLVLAYTYEDAFAKVKLIVERCRQRNVVLKFSKTWIGFKEVNFFGFICKHKSFSLSNQRKESIFAFPFPDSTVKMQRFLGTANFFSSFIPKYSEFTAPLNDMVHDKFNWSKATWKMDYEKVFQEFKEKLVQACALYYPDYSLDWVLRCDASDIAVAIVLLQIAIREDGSKENQPLMFASEKLSDQAKKWFIYEKELYAPVFGVKKCDYLLRCKPFVIETDHRNIQWMEKSVVPKVVRWRVYLSSFHFLIRHIPGKTNNVADWQSRMYMVKDKVHEILSKVHGGRVGHHGERRTWELLNQHFPGHGIPYRVICDFVSECGTCQKDRLGMLPADCLQPVVRSVKPEQARSVVGVDTLTVTPEDKFGNKYVIVVVVLFTKFCALYPVKDKEAKTTASVLFQFFTTYGGFDAIASDPGSDFMSEVVQHLQRWMGIRHTVSLVDRHQSNGVEGTNKLILRHVKALVCDERISDEWSDPINIGWIMHMLNSFPSSESGVVPIEAMFGSADRGYFQFNELEGKSAGLNVYVQKLDKSLSKIRKIAKDYQDNLKTSRAEASSEVPQNLFQPGDFVLKKLREMPSKLTTKYSGPFEVISQEKNDVSCRHLVQGSVHTFHVTDIKIFHGTREEATKLAMVDFSQYVVKSILGWRGDPATRTTMEFLVEFEDGSQVWKTWDKDITDTVCFEEYCRAHSPLRFLIYSRSIADTMCRELRNSDITEVQPGVKVYVDLRSYGATWYANLPLPDAVLRTYAVEYEYTEWFRGHRKIKCVCPVFNEEFTVDRVFVQTFGMQRTMPVGWILIDREFTRQYPQVMPSVNVVSSFNTHREISALVKRPKRG